MRDISSPQRSWAQHFTRHGEILQAHCQQRKQLWIKINREKGGGGEGMRDVFEFELLPILTLILAFLPGSYLHETFNNCAWFGICFSLPALPHVEWKPHEGGLLYCFIVVMWTTPGTPCAAGTPYICHIKRKDERTLGFGSRISEPAQFNPVQSLSCVRLFATPWAAAC